MRQPGGNGAADGGWRAAFATLPDERGHCWSVLASCSAVHDCCNLMRLACRRGMGHERVLAAAMSTRPAAAFLGTFLRL